MLPAASEASAVTVCDPALAVRVSHEAWKGGVVTGAPTGWPSTLNCTRVTPTLSDAVAPSGTMPLIVVAAFGSVTVTCGAVVSGGGGRLRAGEDLDGGEVPLVGWSAPCRRSPPTVPAAGVAEVCDCAQKVSPLPVSSHWWRIDLLGARACAPSARVPVVAGAEDPRARPRSWSASCAARPSPRRPPLDAPTPPAPAKATTVSDWS